MINIDVAEVSELAADLIEHERNKLPRIINAALTPAISALAANATASAEQIRDTGALALSVFHDTRGYARRVGSSDPAGLMNEYGTAHMAPRPWLSPHVKPAADMFVAGLIAGLKGLE